MHKQIPVNVVEYLKSPPSIAQLEELQTMLSCSVSEMVRSNEEEFAALGLAQAADADLLRAIAAHPKLLQRPIVVFGKRAVVGRPPELVSSLLED